MGVYCEEEGKAKMPQWLYHFTEELALERSLRNEHVGVVDSFRLLLSKIIIF